MNNLHRPENTGKKKIALVIGWGSVKCAASLGLMRVLRREGIEIDLVVASGGGSIFGSLLALGYDVESIIEMNNKLWTNEIAKQPNRFAIFQILFPKIFKVKNYFHLRDDSMINERLNNAFGDNTFSDTKIPLFIAATDYSSGAQVTLSEGSIFEAVRASIALPFIFPPFKKDEKLLADGFLSDPLPVGVAIQERADIILAMGFESVPKKKRTSVSDFVLHINGVLSNNLLQASFAYCNLAHHSDLIPIIPQFEDEIHMFDTDKIPAIIEAGEREGEKLIPTLKNIIGTSK